MEEEASLSSERIPKKELIGAEQGPRDPILRRKVPLKKGLLNLELTITNGEIWC